MQNRNEPERDGQGLTEYERNSITALLDIMHYGKKAHAARPYGEFCPEAVELYEASSIVAVRDVMSDSPGFIGDIFLIIFPDSTTAVIRRNRCDDRNRWLMTVTGQESTIVKNGV